jgi:hypothetical protein
MSDIQKSDLKMYKKMNNILENVYLCKNCNYFY